MAREGQGYPRWQRDMMMMMIYLLMNLTIRIEFEKSQVVSDFFFNYYRGFLSYTAKNFLCSKCFV